jgi:hypothetical protein
MAIVTFRDSTARQADTHSVRVVYSLTAVGEQRVKEESPRLESMLSQFVEQGDMEESFRKFLDQRKPIGDN